MPRGVVWIAIAGAAAILVWTSTIDEPAPTPPRPSTPNAILEFDGVSILRADVDRWLPYLESWDPHSGRKSRVRAALERTVIPIAMARHDFAPARAEQRARAAELRSVVGNSIELQRYAEERGVEQAEKPYSRGSLPLGVAEFAFEETHVGAVSDPIETERGYVLVGVRDLRRGLATAYDVVDIVVYPFYTADRDAHDRWFDAAKQSAAQNLTYVHPEFAELLPSWLTPREH